METNILEKLTREMQIAPEFIIREDWEMKILEKLAESNIGQILVLKGGTALRLAYNSPRFSEDLNFDISAKFDFFDFEKVIKGIAAGYSLKLKDLAKKYYAYLARINIKDENLSRDFSIKIEVSTRSIRPPAYSEPKLIVSPVNSIQVLIKTARLEEIKKEKIKALKSRKQPRDLFDLWYIAQLNRDPWSPPQNGYDQKVIKRELYKFLPQKFKRVIKELI